MSLRYLNQLTGPNYYCMHNISVNTDEDFHTELRLYIGLGLRYLCRRNWTVLELEGIFVANIKFISSSIWLTMKIKHLLSQAV